MPRRCLLMLVLALAAQVLAQPPTFTDLSLDQALEESRRERRLLLVYLRGDGKDFEDMDNTTWKSPTIREWVLWHGLAVRLDRHDDKEQFQAVRRAALDAQTGPAIFDPAKRPMVLIFRDGVLDRMIPDPRFQQYLIEENPIYGRGAPPTQVNPYPTTLNVLYGVDFYMDTLRSTQPAWFAAHEHKNPMPPRPPAPPPLFPVADRNAPAFGGEGADALEVLAEAREQTDFGADYDATATYSWLWEEGAAKDPALLPLRHTVLADEITALASRREGSRLRLAAIRDAMLALQPWWTYTDLYEWMVVSRVVGDATGVLEFFDLYLNDPGEGSIVGHADKAAYRLLTGSGGPTGPVPAPEALATWVAEQAPLLSASAPAGIAPEEWGKVQALRRRMVTDNACRAYAAFLAAGDDTRAEEVASRMLASVDDGPARAALVACAVAAGQARPARHESLLREAAARGCDRPQLLARVLQKRE